MLFLDFSGFSFRIPPWRPPADARRPPGTLFFDLFAPFGAPGASLEGPWGSLGGPWEVPGAPLECPGASLGGPGDLFGAPWGVLEGSLAPPKVDNAYKSMLILMFLSWSLFGSWPLLGAPFRSPWAPWRALGASWRALGALLGASGPALAASRGHLEASRGGTGRPSLRWRRVRRSAREPAGG